MTGRPSAIRLHPEDDVAIATRDLEPGTQVPGLQGAALRAPLASGHKLALLAVAQGQPVRRYGQVIGFATQAIHPGEHVHTHNLAMGAFERDYAFGVEACVPDRPAEQATFQGIVRALPERDRAGGRPARGRARVRRDYRAASAEVACRTCNIAWAPASDEAGFWPVTSSPSVTT